MRVDSEKQGLPTENVIEAASGNSCGQGQTLPTNMEAIRVAYAMVSKGNRMSEDDYMGMGDIHHHVHNAQEGIDGQA